MARLIAPIYGFLREAITGYYYRYTGTPIFLARILLLVSPYPLHIPTPGNPC